MASLVRFAVIALVLAAAGCEDPYAPRVGAPALLRHAAGNAQRDTIGAILPESLAVRVVDGAGAPVRGVTVAWDYDESAGTIAPATAVTDADGIVRAQWTLGRVPGPLAANATVAGLEPLGFSAIALSIVRAGPLDWTLVHQGLPEPPDRIIGIAGSNPSDVFTATRSGQVYWFDGFGWSELISHGAPGHLEAMWGPASVAVYAVGITSTADTAFVGRFVGQHWTTPYRTTGERLHAIHGVTATNLWAVGTSIVHNDGASWVEVPYAGAEAHAVWAANTDSAFVGDDAGAVHVVDTRVSTIRLAGGPGITALFGFSTADVYAGDASGAILHWDGVQWTQVMQVGSGPVRAIWGHVPGELWAVGDAFARLSAGNWSVLTDDQGLAAHVIGLWGTSMQDVWGVTDSLRLKHYDGLRWSEDWDSPVAFEGVWGSAASNLHVCGGQGTIQRFDGNGWSTEKLAGWQACRGMDGPSASLAVAATTTDVAYLFDGSDWQQTSTGTALAGAVWVDGSGIAMAPGPPGIVMRYDGSAWTPLATGTSVQLLTLWGSAPDDVWAGGSGGTLLHYDGQGWSIAQSGTTGSIRRIWGSDDTHAFSVSDDASGGSTILRYDGTGWSAVHQSSTPLRAVHGRTEADAFAAGDHGLILRWDGSQWHTEDTGLAEDLLDVWASPEGDVFAVGARGTIVRGRRAP